MKIKSLKNISNISGCREATFRLAGRLVFAFFLVFFFPKKFSIFEKTKKSRKKNLGVSEFFWKKIRSQKKIYIGYIIFSRSISNNIAPRRRIFLSSADFLSSAFGLGQKIGLGQKYSPSRGYTVGYSPRKFDITLTYIKAVRTIFSWVLDKLEVRKPKFKITL